MSEESEVKISPERKKKAEEFADRMEAKMRLLGSTGDYFCSEQHQRWRQHAISAYLGLSPQPEDGRPGSTSDVPEIPRP